MVSKYRDILEPPARISRSPSFSSQSGMTMTSIFYGLLTFIENPALRKSVVNSCRENYASGSWLLIVTFSCTLNAQRNPLCTTPFCTTIPTYKAIKGCLSFNVQHTRVLHVEYLFYVNLQLKVCLALYSDKLANIQVVINCQYSIAQMCTHEDAFASYLGAPSLDDVMSHNELTTIVQWSLHTNVVQPCRWKFIWAIGWLSKVVRCN